MREFIKLSPLFWTDALGRALREAGPAAQVLALYLTSNQHVNYLGLYKLPVAYACADLGMTQAAFLKNLAKVEATGFAQFDQATEFVWIVEGARQQIGDVSTIDKRLKFVQREFDALPQDCAQRTAFFAKYAKMLNLSGNAPAAHLAHPSAAVGLPMPTTPGAAAKAAFNASLKTLIAQRTLDRETFPEEDDEHVRILAWNLIDETNPANAAKCLERAIAGGTLPSCNWRTLSARIAAFATSNRLRL